MRSLRIGVILAAALTMSLMPAAGEDFERSVPPYPALPFPPGTNPQQTLCGSQPTFQDVELYNGTLGVAMDYVKQLEDSTAQLRWLSKEAIKAKLPDHTQGNIGDYKWCSGTLVAKNIFLTAAHCIQIHKDYNGGWVTPARPTDDGPIPAEPKVLATLQTVNFTYQVAATTGQVREPDVYPVAKLLEFGFDLTPKLDYAVLEIGPNAAGKLPGDVHRIASVTARDPVSGEVTALFQHPDGMPKKIEAGSISSVVGTRVYYGDVDTLGGSSGSGIRDRDGILIGVHTNGGCPYSGNAGVTFKAIKGASSLF